MLEITLYCCFLYYDYPLKRVFLYAIFLPANQDSLIWFSLFANTGCNVRQAE